MSTGWSRPSWLVVADGQSLANYGATTTNSPTPWPGAGVVRWIDYLMAGRGPLSIAVDGQAWNELAPTQATRLGDVLYDGLETLVLVLCGGQGDLFQGDDAATIYAEMGAYADAARVVAADVPQVVVVAQTIPPNGLHNPGVIQPAANALILADAGGHFDEVVDVVVAPLTPLSFAYYGDGLHWNNLANQVVAGLLAPVVNPYLP